MPFPLLAAIGTAIAGGAASSAVNNMFNKPKQPALDKQIANQYGKYMPQINEQLWQMAGTDPAYQRGQYLDQAAALRRYADATRGSTMRAMQQGGMGNSLAAQNMLGGLDLDTIRALAANLQQYQQGRDARRQGILGQMAGNVGQNVGPALQAQLQSQAAQSNMMGALGQGVGNLVNAYMQSKMQYPQMPGAGVSQNYAGAYGPYLNTPMPDAGNSMMIDPVTLMPTFPPLNGYGPVTVEL
jgi:hypothetical protein